MNLHSEKERPFMNKMDKKEAKALIAKFARNLPLSAMSLCYLFERGSAQVMNTSEEEYSAAVDAEIAKAEANGGIYLLSKETALKVLRWAKELAAVEPIDLIALLGNGVYSEKYLETCYGEGAFLATRSCPHCGSSVFFRDEDDEEIVTCCECGKRITDEPDD
jgi:hypothetical protein